MLVMAFCATSSLYAQEKNPKARIADRISYMKSHLTLGQKESQTFWKVYEQYLNDEMKALDTYRKNLEKQGIKLGAPGTNKDAIAKLTDKQLTYLHDQKFQLRQNLLNLETSYYKKFKAILTPRQIQDLYNLEYKYKKQMTQKKKEGPKEDPAMINSGKKKR